jgi:hypothetical protein
MWIRPLPQALHQVHGRPPLPEDQGGHHEQEQAAVLPGGESGVADVDDSQEIYREPERSVEHEKEREIEADEPGLPAEDVEEQGDADGVDRLVEPQIVPHEPVRIRLAEQEVRRASRMVVGQEAPEASESNVLGRCRPRARGAWTPC